VTEPDATGAAGTTAGSAAVEAEGVGDGFDLDATGFSEAGFVGPDALTVCPLPTADERPIDAAGAEVGGAGSVFAAVPAVAGGFGIPTVVAPGPLSAAETASVGAVPATVDAAGSPEIWAMTGGADDGDVVGLGVGLPGRYVGVDVG
jgi:hypothetical protein